MIDPTLDPKFNRRIVERLRAAIVDCNLNHVPQAVRRVIQTGAWRERVEVNLHWKFDKFCDFITASPVEGGMGWKPELVEGLLQKAEDRDALKLWQEAIRADDARERDAQDQANKAASTQGRRTDLFDKNFFNTNKNDVKEVKAPAGNSETYALRKLRKDRPDIHARVLNGELSAHAGMIEAEFRDKQASRKMTPLDQLRRWWKKASEEQRATFRGEIE
jgi:hypothetical protein